MNSVGRGRKVALKMNPADIIRDKIEQQPIRTADLRTFISGYVNGDIDDDTMTRLLQAIYDHGMDLNEVFTLVDIMINSGKRMDFSLLGNYICDKHSIGGVGDKTSLIIAPLLASAGLVVPMMAGRSLGHTGGTIDKLETIPGFQAELPISDFQQVVAKVGCGIMAQTYEICPADGKIYALRNVTNTIASIPLICGSIMSKKIAEGIQGLVLDIKVGNGSFTPTLAKATELAAMLQAVGEYFNIKTDVVFSNMDQPLGRCAGMWCEVQEVLDCLQDQGPQDTMAVSLKLASRLMIQSGMAADETESNSYLQTLIADGSAYAKFQEMIVNHGGVLGNADNRPAYVDEVTATQDGYIQSLNTTMIGWALVDMGCGRRRKNDKLDHSAGLKCHKKMGDRVHQGETIFSGFCNSEAKLNVGIVGLTSAVKIGSNPVVPPLFYGQF